MGGGEEGPGRRWPAPRLSRAGASPPASAPCCSPRPTRTWPTHAARDPSRSGCIAKRRSGPHHRDSTDSVAVALWGRTCGVIQQTDVEDLELTSAG
eukprot:3627236-Rhodomonas_salina.2